MPNINNRNAGGERHFVPSNDNMTRILYIESNARHTVILFNFLTKIPDREFKTFSCKNLKEASEFLAQEKVDLIFLNHNVVDGRGLESIQYVVNLAQGIPVVVIADDDAQKNQLTAVQYGAYDYVQRAEVSPKVLSRVIGYSIERAKNEIKLTQAREKTEKLLASITSILIGIRRDGIITHWNPVAEKNFGVPADKMIGKNLSACPISWNVVSILNGIEVARMKNSPVRLDDVYFVDAGGKDGYLGISIIPMESDQNGEMEFLIFGANITERKIAEDELADEKERLSVTLRSIGDGVITIDTSGRIVMMNPVAEKITGWFFDEVLDEPVERVYKLVSRKQHESLAHPIDRVMETGSETRIRKAILIARDGHEFVVSEGCSPMKDPKGNMIGFILVFRDITDEEKIAEEMIKKSKLDSIGVLAGGIAHDFNNLLTGILGNVNLLKHELNQNREAVRRLVTAERALDRAQMLTKQLLTFAKGGSPILETLHMGILLSDSVEFALRGSNIKAEFNIADDLWLTDIDSGQISQVIDNVVINSKQATPNGGMIEVSAENRSVKEQRHTPYGDVPPGDYVCITIRDHGTGIDQEHVNRIFDPYFTTKPKGSGLGLATSYSIIKNHNGYVVVESEKNVGTTFGIYLPKSDKKPIDPIELVGEKPRMGLGKVLVMDDEEIIRELFSEALSQYGYQVNTASSGEEALEVFQSEKERGRPFDLVIMDLTVPGGMGGKDLMVRLLQVDPKIKSIVTSGYSTDPIMANYRRYGFQGIIPKPFKMEQLNKVVRQVLIGKNGT